MKTWGLTAVALVAGTVMLAGCGGSSNTAKRTSTPKPTPATVTVRGTLTLSVGDALNIDDVACTGMDGFDDITKGASVYVTDASNKTIGVGKLAVAR